ncbi:MAG TPA: chemotaxis protein CheW, partial [Pseudoxanthomonas sp.]
MAHSNDEIRGVLIQAGEYRLLLPNATVAEVLTRAPVEPIEGMPDWLPGRIDWHGWPVPLVAFGRLSGNPNDPVALNSKIVVLKALSGDKDRPYFA